jgi:multiple sugar transport system ATP-binding protein
MHDGQVEQMGAPLELYDRPANQFVAGFIGSPAMNFLDGKLSTNGSAYVQTAVGSKLPLKTMPQGSAGQDVVYGIRPEHFELGEGGLDAEVVVVEPTGSETQVVARLDGHEIIAVFRERQNVKPGDRIPLRPRADAAHLFAKDTGKRI